MTEFNGSSTSSVVSVKSFYGNDFKIPFEDKIANDYTKRKTLPHRLNNLFGPTQIWKIFQKQSEALEYAKSKRSGVMVFAFQQWDGIRAFLVAHPQIFWHYDVQKPPSERCSYEIIPEFSACKLYLDLEFEVKLNQGKKGPVVVNTLVAIVLYFLSILFNVKASKQNIINLDSSTDAKFSRHLIFIIHPYVFEDNKTVGEFMSFISKKIDLYLMTHDEADDTISKSNDSKECNCCQLNISNSPGCVKDVGLPRENIQDLFVLNRKGNQQLIYDQSVYSKNRHFRLYKNTKWRQSAHLVLSNDNEYTPLIQNSKDDYLYSEKLFLDSLISNIESENVCDINVIRFKNRFSQVNKLDSNVPETHTTELECKFVEMSPFPAVDKFINSIICDGKIRKTVYFYSSSIIVYDIAGYRYCENIGRQHQSNNVKYVVNLNDYTYYQKCYDPDCSKFRSVPIALPIELRFYLGDVSIDSFDECSISDSDLVEVANAIEDMATDYL